MISEPNFYDSEIRAPITFDIRSKKIVFAACQGTGTAKKIRIEFSGVAWKFSELNQLKVRFFDLESGMSKRLFFKRFRFHHFHFHLQKTKKQPLTIFLTFVGL